METFNTFSGGINRDLDKSLLKNSMAYNIENFRLVTAEGVSTGALENVKGNALSVTIPDISNMYFITLDATKQLPVTFAIGVSGQPYGSAIITSYSASFTYTINTTITDLYNFINNTFVLSTGVCYIPGLIISLINSTIVLYSTTSNITFTIPIIGGGYYLAITTIPSQPNLRIIGYANIRETTVLFTTNCMDTDSAIIDIAGYGQLWRLDYDDTQIPSIPTLTLLYNNLLKFSDYHLVEALGRFETTGIRKVYWADYYNYLRFCNIDQSDLMILPPSSLDMINDSVLTVPKLRTVTTGGIYKSGVVQYAYQLYNLYGAETTFSSCSNLIHLTTANESVSDTRSYSGSVLNKYTGKSVIIDINNIDSRFDNAKVVAIFWDTLNGSPAIRYVYDGGIPTSQSLEVIDDGSTSYGSLTADEFNSLGGVCVIPKTITSKYDYMFLGNIKEPSWDIDFDARAYRFDKATLYSTPNNAIVEDYAGNQIPVNTSLPNWGIPLDHDAICPFNSNVTSAYKYQHHPAGTIFPMQVFGGSGPNVSYKFETKDTIGDGGGVSDHYTYAGNYKNDIGLNVETYQNDSFDNEASPQVDGLIRSYQRDEIYRFGLVFYNKKMKPSFVHWIADIRMPHLTADDYPILNTVNKEYNLCDYDVATATTVFHHLGIQFSVDLSSLSTQDRNNITSISIVRVLRTGNDRTVISNGALTPTSYNALDPVTGINTGIHMAGVSANWTSGNKDLFEFDSPEVNFNKNITYIPGDYLDTFGYHQMGGTGYTTLVNDPSPNELVYKCRTIKPYGALPLYNWGIEDAKIVGYGYGTIYTIGSYNYRNYIDNSGTGSGYHGTAMIIKTNTTHIPALIVTLMMVAANYKRVLSSQYGGNTYNARLYNEYIECARINCSIGNNNYSISVYGGDTFLCMYDYLRWGWDNTYGGGANPSYREFCYFPVESSINLWLRHDECASKGGGITMLQENFATGVQNYGSTVYPTYLTDLYLYNSVYSQENILKTFFPRPLNFQDVELHDVTLMSSQKKENGEDIDNWLVYLPNDRKEVDSNYGQINRILNWKNYIFYWQDSGFGTQYVLPRSLITDNNVTELVLGTGTVLDKHDYISTNVGCRNQRGIAFSKDSLVWFDLNTKKLHRYSDRLSVLSDVKGLKSYFANSDSVSGNILDADNVVHSIHPVVPDGSHPKSGIICEYDERYNEFLVSICSSTDILNTGNWTYSYITLAYSDIIDAFTSFYSFDPAWYIKTNNKLITVPKSDLSEVWIQNTGLYCTFYNFTYDSKVDFYVKDNYSYSKVFDCLEYLADVTSNDISLLKEGISKIRCWNGTQNSDWFDLRYYEGNFTGIPLASNETYVTRRESNWNLQVPRNAVILNLPSNPDIFNPANLDQTRPFMERIRDNFMVINMIYENANNFGFTKDYRIIIPYVKTIYRASIR